MDDVCRQQITSEDYADFLVEYNIDLSVLRERYQSDCINIINRKYAVVHVPVSFINRNTIVDFGYSVFPDCYSLDNLASLDAAGVNQMRNAPGFDLTGREVIIAIIDTGIDYTNQAFRNADGTTRILSIWDQTIESDNYPEEFNYGTVYTSEQINEALNSEDPYSIVPSRDEIGHGTMLASLAGGTPDLPNNFSGVATGAYFVIVKLKQAKNYLRDLLIIPHDVPCYQENDIMFGVTYASLESTKYWKALAICIALGSNQGGHDGKGALNDNLSFNGDRVGTAIVVSAGNESNLGHHFRGDIDEEPNYRIMELSVSPNEPGFFLEIWGSAPNTYSIDILSPTGEYIPRIPARLGENREISFLFERTTIDVDYIIVDPSSGDQLILVRFHQPTEGIWRIRVYGSGGINMSFDAWLPTAPFVNPQTKFVTPSPDTTITEPGTSAVPITVTSYNFSTNSIELGASRGYTRLGEVKPDLAAPGVNLVVPSIDNTYTTTSGTSPAAGFTTGIAALLLEWGIINRNSPLMDCNEVKKLLIRGANRQQGITYPNNIWGYGTVNIFGVFQSFTEDTAEITEIKSLETETELIKEVDIDSESEKEK